ncbi:bifunctional 5,10-methylenetetrahydrofolate dehydrogenase/5,10-methenyltetrahydrofolate cyclohydrolase [Pseudomonadota bacterium]
MQLLSGKKVAEEMYEKLQGDIAALKEKGVDPKLVIILVGENAASLSYIKSKRKAAEKVGIEEELITYAENDIDTERLIAKIHELNEDASVHGILVQLPLPKHIYEPDVIKAIMPAKDVDGFTAYNIGKMFLSTDFEDLAPCTPLGVIHILESYNLDIEGKEAVVVGRSNIAGKPLALMLLNRGATVTVCHSKTKDVAAHTKNADILVSAVGKINFITEDMVKEGATVIDIGINRNDEGRIVGDVNFENVSKKTSYITPVPGGCGLMTVACLMENVYKAALKQTNQS